MISYLKNLDKGNCITILMILFLSAGFLVLNDYISSAATIILWFLVLFYLFKKFRAIDSAIATPAFVILGWYVLSSVINGDSIYTVLGCSFGFIVSIIFASTRRITDFQSSYIEVLKILSIISLVGFFSLTFLPFVSNLLSPFIRYTTGGNPFYNLYIFIFKPLHFRNMGMFWEPGAFQIFVNIALLFEILKPKPSVTNVVVFLITIITTFSTTGYIAIIIVFTLVLLNRSQELKKTKTIFWWILPVLIALFIYNAAYLTDTSSYSTFGKITSFVEDEEWNSAGEATSGSIRFYSVTKTVEAFVESPLFGKGTRGLEKRNFNYTYGMNTCTFANWFGKYGVVYGLLMLIGFIHLSSFLGNNKGNFTKFLILIFFFTITATEAVSESPIMFLLCLYGYNSQHVLLHLKKNDKKMVDNKAYSR